MTQSEKPWAYRGTLRCQFESDAQLAFAAPDLADVVERNAQTFERYAELHRAKCTPEGDRKAAENQAEADRCRAALLKANGGKG